MPRSDWRDEDIIEPAEEDRTWEPGQRPPAQWQNWYHRQVVLDIIDIAQTVFVDAGDAVGRVQSPLEIGGTALGSVHVDDDFVGTFGLIHNAEWNEAENQWEQIDSAEGTPSAILYEPNLNSFDGVASTQSDSWVLLEAETIDAEGVITDWIVAPAELGQSVVRGLFGNDQRAQEFADAVDQQDLTTLSQLQDHNTQHESGGDDEISVQGLSGDLADPQDPKNHAADHNDGGDDELSATDLANVSEEADANTAAVRQEDGTLVASDATANDELVTYGQVLGQASNPTGTSSGELHAEEVTQTIPWRELETVNTQDANYEYNACNVSIISNHYRDDHVHAAMDNVTTTNGNINGVNVYNVRRWDIEITVRFFGVVA